MKYSLKTRMIFFGLFLHAFIWLLATSAASYTTAQVIFENLDKDLKEQTDFVRFSSRLFQSFYTRFDVNDGYDPMRDGAEISESIGWKHINVVIWSMQGNLIFRSTQAPGFDLPTKNGFSDESFIQQGKENKWRLYSENIDDIFWVTVGTNTKEARQSAYDFGLKALYPMILIIPLTIFAVFLGSKKGLSSINKVAREVTNRKPNSLTLISEHNVPEEVYPVVSSLNGLLKRLKSAIENEHRFTANSAHELQTPLAAIKTELQLCQRRTDDPEVAKDLNRIATRVDRAVYTVKQLLTLARIESEDVQLHMDALDLRTIVSDDLADLAHIAVERELQINYPDAEPWLINGSKESLSILIRNLLTNAFRYTTQGGVVEVGAKVLPNTIKFYVANDSVAITAQEREKMVDSFYRLPGNEMPGAGLGLSIVQRIVEVHQAQLEIGAWKNNDGVKVTVSFSRLS